MQGNGIDLKENKIDEAKKVFEEGKQKFKINRDPKYLKGYMDGAFLIGNYYEKNNSMKWLNMIKYINTIVLLCTIKKQTKYIEVF